MRSLIVTLVLLAFFVSGYGQTGHLRVQGEAIVAAQPEQLIANIPIQTRHDNYEQCAKQLTTTYNALGDALVKAGLERSMIKSGGLNITQNYTWVDRERKPDGYLGSIQVNIEMPHTTRMLNAFMQTLNDERFTFGYNLGFSFSEAQREALQKEAVAKAVADARAKGEALAAGLGVKLLHIEEVSYGLPDRGHDPIALRSMSKEGLAAADEIEINPSEQEVRRVVQITWVIAN